MVNLLLAVGLLTLSPLRGRRAQAQAPAPAPAQRETFTAKTINLAVGAGQDLKIDVFRWSTDDERKAILTALKGKGDAGVADALPKSPSLGSLWTNENLGYTIRYAYRDTTSNGSDRVILLIDRRLGSWAGQVWKTPGSSEAPDYPFVLIELHLSRTGTGEGKMSLTTKVAADEGGMTLALADYNPAPVLLRPVKHEPERRK
jgi:hypothetical protein